MSVGSASDEQLPPKHPTEDCLLIIVVALHIEKFHERALNRSVRVHPANSEGKAMADMTGIEQEVQITERTKHAMENYFSWLQTAMSGSPWSNTDLN